MDTRLDGYLVVLIKFMIQLGKFLIAVNKVGKKCIVLALIQANVALGGHNQHLIEVIGRWFCLTIGLGAIRSVGRLTALATVRATLSHCRLYRWIVICGACKQKTMLIIRLRIIIDSMLSLYNYAPLLLIACTIMHSRYPPKARKDSAVMLTWKIFWIFDGFSSAHGSHPIFLRRADPINWPCIK